MADLTLDEKALTTEQMRELVETLVADSLLAPSLGRRWLAALTASAPAGTPPSLADRLRAEATYREGGWDAPVRDALRRMADVLDGDVHPPFYLHSAPPAVEARDEDTRRMDWLERRHAQLIPCQTDFAQWDGWNVWDDITHCDLGDGETIRQAIDAAMAAARSPETGDKDNATGA